jgi:hypothetical protein
LNFGRWLVTIEHGLIHSARGLPAVVEWLVISAIAAVLLLIAAYFLRRAVGVLRRTTPAFEMLPDERRYLRRQAWCRIVNSSLMVFVAMLLIGAYAAGLPQRADEIGKQRDAAAVDGKKPPLTEEQRDFGRVFGGYWIGVLLVVGLMLFLAGLDLLVTRRYGLTQLRRIQSDRRAMLQRQLARWREEREGPALD